MTRDDRRRKIILGAVATIMRSFNRSTAIPGHMPYLMQVMPGMNHKASISNQLAREIDWSLLVLLIKCVK